MGAPTRGDEASQSSYRLCASPVADGTTAGADLRSTVVHFALHVAATDCLCDLAARAGVAGDRKSTRLNSSHLGISYAVFCLKKKKKTTKTIKNLQKLLKFIYFIRRVTFNILTFSLLPKSQNLKYANFKTKNGT